jgi:hypothetical protein
LLFLFLFRALCLSQLTRARAPNAAADADASHALCESLGVSVFPTIQFYRRGALLWATEGYDSGLQDTAEGVLYFADTAAVSIYALIRH